MKLIAGTVFVCFFLLSEARRVPDYSESTNSDVELDDVKNVHSNLRRKRHYTLHSRNLWEPGMDQSYLEFYQNNRISELEIRLQILQEQMNELQFRRYEPKVTIVPVCIPSSGPQNTTDPFTNRNVGLDDIDNQRLWGNGDDQNTMRPISLRPIRPNRPMPKQPPVQHGTVQAETSTKAPYNLDICKIAILICCDSDGIERKNCFKKKFNCDKVSNSENACNKIILDQIKKDVIAAYAPDVE